MKPMNRMNWMNPMNPRAPPPVSRSMDSMEYVRLPSCAARRS